MTRYAVDVEHPLMASAMQALGVEPEELCEKTLDDFKHSSPEIANIRYQHYLKLKNDTVNQLVHFITQHHSSHLSSPKLPKSPSPSLQQPPLRTLAKVRQRNKQVILGLLQQLDRQRQFSFSEAKTPPMTTPKRTNSEDLKKLQHRVVVQRRQPLVWERPSSRARSTLTKPVPSQVLPRSSPETELTEVHLSALQAKQLKSQRLHLQAIKKTKAAAAKSLKRVRGVSQDNTSLEEAAAQQRLSRLLSKQEASQERRAQAAEARDREAADAKQRHTQHMQRTMQRAKQLELQERQRVQAIEQRLAAVDELLQKQKEEESRDCLVRREKQKLKAQEVSLKLARQHRVMVMHQQETSATANS